MTLGDQPWIDPDFAFVCARGEIETALAAMVYMVPRRRWVSSARPDFTDGSTHLHSSITNGIHAQSGPSKQQIAHAHILQRVILAKAITN